MQRTFNPQNRARYPGRPPAFANEDGVLKIEDGNMCIRYPLPSIFHPRFNNASWCNSSISGFDPDGLGATPSEATSLN